MQVAPVVGPGRRLRGEGGVDLRLEAVSEGSRAVEHSCAARVARWRRSMRRRIGRGGHAECLSRTAEAASASAMQCQRKRSVTLLVSQLSRVGLASAAPSHRSRASCFGRTATPRVCVHRMPLMCAAPQPHSRRANARECQAMPSVPTKVVTRLVSQLFSGWLNAAAPENVPARAARGGVRASRRVALASAAPSIAAAVHHASAAPSRHACACTECR